MVLNGGFLLTIVSIPPGLWGKKFLFRFFPWLLLLFNSASRKQGEQSLTQAVFFLS